MNKIVNAKFKNPIGLILLVVFGLGISVRHVSSESWTSTLVSIVDLLDRKIKVSYIQIPVGLQTAFRALDKEYIIDKDAYPKNLADLDVGVLFLNHPNGVDKFLPSGVLDKYIAKVKADTEAVAKIFRFTVLDDGVPEPKKLLIYFSSQLPNCELEDYANSILFEVAANPYAETHRNGKSSLASCM